MPKSGHVIIMKVENLHIYVENSQIPKMLFFSIRRKITKLSRKNRLRTVASAGGYERLAVLNIEARRQYILLVFLFYFSTDVFFVIGAIQIHYNDDDMKT